MSGVELSVIVPAWGDRPQAAGAINRYRDSLESVGASFELLILEEPRVWGAAICLGLHRAKGDYVLAGVDDCPVVNDDWWLHARRLAAGGDVVGACVLDPRTSPPQRVWFCQPAELDKQQGRIPFAMTPLARRDVWEGFGPLPPTHAYTDIYVADKARKQGRRVVCCQEWKAVHLCQGSASLEDGDVYEAWKEIYL